MVRWDMGLNRKRLAYFEFNTDDSGLFFPRSRDKQQRPAGSER